MGAGHDGPEDPSSNLDRMDERAVLIEGFEYDYWATSAWLAAVPSMPDSKRPLEVLEHMAWAQTTWIGRVRPGIAIPKGSLEARLKALNDEWVSVAMSTDLREVLDYKTTTGEPYRTEVAAILRHVIDHGTYHRGQLRGLAEMQGWEDFPDVGLIGYYRTFGLHA